MSGDRDDSGVARALDVDEIGWEKVSKLGMSGDPVDPEGRRAEWEVEGRSVVKVRELRFFEVRGIIPDEEVDGAVRGGGGDSPKLKGEDSETAEAKLSSSSFSSSISSGITSDGRSLRPEPGLVP